MQIDHLVLTGEAIQATCDFYSRVLGMQVVTFAEGRKALQFGKQKINLHQRGKEFDPKARHPTPGSADLCFLTPTPLEHAIAHLQFCDIPIILGPIERIGAIKPLVSLYFRDPGGTSSTSQMLADRLV